MSNPDIDIWRAATLMLRRYGADADLEAAKRADEMLERGDREGQIVWMRIGHAIAELTAPPQGKPN